MITKVEIGIVILMFCFMGLAFYAGYYTAIKQAKDAIRYAKSVVRWQSVRNQIDE